MNPLEFIAPMVVAVTAILTVGGVIILRPLSNRLAELLHAMSREKATPSQLQELDQVRAQLAAIESRLALMEERQGFTEALLESGRGRARAALPDAPRDP
jgi:hypothetical protein